MEEQLNIITSDSLPEDDEFSYIKMDFSLETPEERRQKVEEIIQNTPEERLTPRYLEKLSDYILMAVTKQEKKDKKLLTDNM